MKDAQAQPVPANKKDCQTTTDKEIRANADHTPQLKRLNRVRGQLEGIQNMILERRYCPEIVNQLKAARAGLQAIEGEILKTHLRGCVRESFLSRDALHVEAKIEEIMKMVF